MARIRPHALADNPTKGRPLLKKLLSRFVPDPDSSLPLLRRLLAENARAHIGSYAIAFFLMALVAATTAGSAWIMKDVINQIFIERDKTMVYAIAATVIGIYLVKGIATYGQTVILAKVGNNIVARNQKRLYGHMLAQGIDFFDSQEMGSLATRMSHNAQAARDVLNQIVTSVGRDLFTLIGLIAVMVFQNPMMAGVALLIAPPAVLGVGYLVKKVRKVAKAEFVQLTRIVGIVQETVAGARVIKAFSAEGAMQTAMDDAVGQVETRANRIATLQARTSPLMETLGGFAVALVIIYGGYAVIELGQDPGSFFAFITALLMAYEPAKRLAKLQVVLGAGLVGVRLMYDLLDTPPTFHERPDATPLTVTEGRIRFDAVEFHYRPDRPALNGVTLEAPPGLVTALVGPSGGGKSTVLSLIERFYEPTGGSVTIDGTAVRAVTFDSLRRQIALVTQDTFLFAGTIRDNIMRGAPGADEAAMIEAARDANAHDFIMEMANGYDTDVGEGGKQLSGGQRQRIAIARAMLRDAPILLLDEATSALDSSAEEKIQQALKRLMKGRTTIVIAHRLSTVRDATVIHVLDRGRVVESGSHETLIAQGGLYRELHRLQFASPEKAAGG